MKIATVDFKDNKFLISCPFYDNERAKMIPDRKWDKKEKVWRASLSSSNIRYLSREYLEEEFTPCAIRKIGEFKDKNRHLKGEYFPGWYEFKNPPMAHQMDALNKAWGKDAFAFFHEMGCGKTYTSIALMSAYAMSNVIDAMLVVCPTAIKHVWPWEIEKHSSMIKDKMRIYVLSPGAKRYDEFLHDDTDKFKILIVGVEALSRGNAKGIVEKFLLTNRCGFVLDESSKIKNHKSKRTKAVVDLGGLAVKRVILTGTPITQGMHDLYSQFRFLDWDILGHKSFYTFQSRYCIMGGFENRQIIGYRNVAELLGLMAPYSHTVSKKEALDLPPKVYESRYVEPTKQQISALRQLKNEMMAEDDGHVLQVKTALDRLTRFSQICGGMFPYELDFGEGQKEYRVKPIDGPNPKMEELLNIIDELPEDASVIIWARFVPEIKMIQKSLEERWPGSTVTYFGETSKEDRPAINKQFQEGKYRFFISNASTGGMGLTLTKATYVIYYSNSYSYQDRVQSEDRAHRKGQENKVTYIDIILNIRTEKEIINALKNKEDVAVMVKNNLISGSFNSMFDV